MEIAAFRQNCHYGPADRRSTSLVVRLLSATALASVVAVTESTLEAKGPVISWAPERQEVTLSPGETRTLQVLARLHTAIPGARVDVVPELSAYLSVVPDMIPPLTPGVEQTLDLTFTIPRDIEPGTIEGTLHLRYLTENSRRGGSGTIARPLPIVINIEPAPDCIDYAGFFQVRGRTSTPGTGRRLAVSGSHAYLASSGSGLQIIDISDPESPVVMGSVDRDPDVRDVAVSGSHSYLADDEGLHVVDISDPSDPFILSSVLTAAKRVEVDGNHAYVTEATRFHVIDITDAAAPAVAGTLELPDTFSAGDVSVGGHHAYVSAESNTSYLRIIDVSNPGSPVLVGSLDNEVVFGERSVVARTLYVTDHLAYVGGLVSFPYFEFLQVIDISNPSEPLVIGEALLDDTSVFFQDMAISHPFAYVACGGICVFDVSDPTAPRLTGNVDISNFTGVSGAATSGEYLFAATEVGLRVHRGARAGLAPIIGSLDTNVFRVAISEDHAVLATGSVLKVVDVSQPGDPALVGSLDLSAGVSDLVASGHHAYVLDFDDRLSAINMAIPQAPAVEGSVTIPQARSMHVYEGRGFVAAGDRGLQVVDIRDPLAPFITGSVEIPGLALGVHASLAHAYVTSAGNFEGLHVVDIVDPGAPSLIGSIATLDVDGDLGISGEHAFVVLRDFGAGLQVVDISSPGSPMVAAQVRLPSLADHVAISGSHAYVAAGIAGLQVVDIRDPASPFLVGMLETRGIARDVALSDKHVFVAALEDFARVEVSGLRVGYRQCAD